MQTQDLYLKFSRNAAGAVIGNLTLGDDPLLSTSHPATLAAAVYAMGATAVTMRTADGECKMPFPSAHVAIIGRQGEITGEEITFLRAYGTFSQVEFKAPEAWDIHADAHLRTAVHHLPKRLVVVRPETPEPRDWKKTFKARNRFIYFPNS
ncbi:MAG: hypothetical protein JWR21_2609 [Herminiimonas sp.]|nr:hypothetical protein [Herminiimonas sp.]